MIRSVRLRLALWHTGALGLLLLVFALATFGYLARSSLRRTDEMLSAAARAFAVDVRAEAVDARDAVEGVKATARNFRFGETRILVFGPGGALVAATPVDTRGAEVDPAWVARRIDAPGGSSTSFRTLHDPQGGARALLAPLPGTAPPMRLVAVQSLHARREALAGVLGTFAVAIPLALLLAGLGGYLLARRSLAPVLEMSGRAERIGASTLHERLPAPNPEDELGHLAGAFNGLLDRLAGALEQQRRFMADAAHELRTPVAVLRGEADVALARPARPEGEYREALAVVREEGRHLSRVVDDLFLLSRADAGEHPLHPGELYLNELLEECVRSVRSIADARGTTLRCDAPEDAPFRGDEALLRRLVLNLLDNAIKYSPPGARVEAVLRRGEGGHRLSVRDSGPEIAPEIRGRIFERFYRSDAARAQAGGAGLGLAIARWIAEAHGGSLSLLEDGGGGNEFLLRLPDREPADDASVSLP